APPQPEVPAPEPEPLPEPEPEVDPTPEPTRMAETEAAVAAALADAIGETAPLRPPLTKSEEDTLRVAVQKCWVVDIGSAAANVTVVLGMHMTPEGKVKPGSLRLVSSQGGADSATKTAFQAARRAVLRCQKGGYNLPTEKYEHWREIEMTFNPEKMR
ncbi:MAG: cell envelope biogenesis protein TolA, partial [Paracoccaceae bacterium]